MATHVIKQDLSKIDLNGKGVPDGPWKFLIF